MRSYNPFVWSLIVCLTSQHVLPRSSDPLADVCSPLCSDQETLALEEDCGRLLGCYDLDIEEDPEVLLACLTPCFAPTEECFSLCAERFDLILQMCYNDCSQHQDPLDCIAVCFNISFMDFKRGLVKDEDNSTGDTNSNFSGLPEVTISPRTADIKPTNSPDVQTEISEVTDTAMPRADFYFERKLDAESGIHDTRFHLENTIELDTSVYNNTTNVDVLYSNETVTIDTSLSKHFPADFQTEWRWLKTKDRSHNHNRGLQSRKSSQFKEATNHHSREENSSKTPPLQPSNKGTN